MRLSKKSKIFLAGHNGMVGKSILKYLKKKKYSNILTVEKRDLDLLNQKETYMFIKKNKPDFVIIAAARVGGILANQRFSADFIYQNLMIQNNLIHSSYKAGVKKLIFLGSSCIYPKLCKQPIKETYLLDGKLEATNESYAIAKISGLKMCEAYNKQYKLNYICLMPTNLYGPNDNYDSNNSHFFPALIRKIYTAKICNKKKIEIWGNGKAKRELLYVDDLAEACEFFLKRKIKHSLINIGSEQEKTIKNFAKFIMKKLNINLKIVYKKNMPNGTPRKKLDISLAKFYGWKSKTPLSKGFDLTYKNFLENFSKKNN
jgi:GDP-L-fucose synthase